MAVDASGNLYVTGGSAGMFVLEVSTKGIVSTVAGSGSGSYSGDGGPATSAGISPTGVAVDSLGNIYITDSINQRLRMVSPDGTITTVAGNGAVGDTGDGGPATSARLDNPGGAAVDSRGRVYFTVVGFVRMLTPTASATSPSISSGGIVTASAFGAFPSVAPGSWIEIYGANLAADSRSWTSADFTGVNAPTSLDGTKVTIGGQPAFIDYISPTQVNAQVPSNVATGSQPVIVTSAAGASTASTIAVNQQEPGLLAPSSFLVGGKQYVAALFSDGATFVLPPGAVAGVPSRRAQPGDTITLYGVGFGPVTPNTPWYAQWVCMTKVISTNHEEGSIRAFVLEDKHGRLTLQLAQFSETQTSGQLHLRNFFSNFVTFSLLDVPYNSRGQFLNHTSDEAALLGTTA